MPTAPDAPGLFTITTGCFRAFSSEAASGRPVRSASPPGGNGLMMVTGRFGNVSSAPAVATTASVTSATTTTSVRIRIASRRTMWMRSKIRSRSGCMLERSIGYSVERPESSAARAGRLRRPRLTGAGLDIAAPSPATGRGGRYREFVGIDRYLDDRGLAAGEGSAHGVADVLRALHVEAARSEELGVAVVARITDVGADVAPVVEVLLVGLLRAPAVVVHHERDDVDAVPHGRLQLLSVHQKAAVAVDRDHGGLGTAELGAECGGKREAEAAEVERSEEGPRP